MASSEASWSPSRFTATTSSLPSNRLQLNITPDGFVQRIRNEIEARTVAQNRESDTVHIRRAREYAVIQRSRHQTYAGRLHIAEVLGLTNLTPSLAEFLRAHDNMYQAINRTSHIALRAEHNSTIDVLTHIAIQIHNLRNIFSYYRITSTFSPSRLQAMRASGEFDADISSLRDSLVNEYAWTLTTWDNSSTTDLEDHELENVGLDHDINDLGQNIEGSKTRNEMVVNVVSERQVVYPLRSPQLGNATIVEGMRGHFLPTPPPSPIISPGVIAMDVLMNEPHDENDDEDDDRRCSICTEPYTESHIAFRLSACGHIYGKACMSKWVNSTARNANLCPQCRAPLCTRRPRRPIQALHGQAEPSNRDQVYLQTRLNRTTQLFGCLADFHSELWGPESRTLFYDIIMTELNWRFFYQDLRWQVVPDETAVDGWRMRRVNWHE